MKREALTYLILLGCLLFPSACQQSDLPDNGEGGYGASLTLSFNTSNARLETRGVEDLDDDGTISELEKVIDGQRMYRLAVFLVEGNTVIASTELRKDDPRFYNDNQGATVTFTRLHYGIPYRLMAVANYGNYDTNTNGHLTTIDISNDMRVSATDDNLCNKTTPYPLSLEKEIVLQPGNNTVSGELLRTYARIRINIRNHSNKELKVTNLKFANRFTQSTADLFSPGGTATVTPDVTSEDAITPFSPDITIAPIDEDNTVAESTIFDGYMLESNGGNYEYTLGLEYEGVTTTDYTVSSTAVTTTGGIKNGAMYVIYNTNARRYLYANGTTAVGASANYNTNGELNHNFVWKFTRVGNSGNNYKIESMGSTGYYISRSGISNRSIPLTVSSSNDNYFTASTSSGNLRFRAATYYLAVNQNNALGATSGNSRNFALYEVVTEQNSSSTKHQETIGIKTIDKVTGEALPLQAVKRNDFINILVNVSYNEESGEVDFEVSDWEEIVGDVTFD